MAEEESMEQWQQILEQHKATLQAARKRKGELPKSRTTRDEIKMQFLQMAMHVSHIRAQGTHYAIRQTVIGEAYAPSAAPLESLEPILITELRLETHHRGRVLFSRAFCDANRIQSVQNGIEDIKNTVDRLAIYNTHPSIPPSKVLPCGAFVAIKEPYYKLAGDGATIIRVDHPSDFILLDQCHPSLPSIWRLENALPASGYKLRGNNAYKSQDYLQAATEYSLGLRACASGDDVLKRNLLRNRALMRLHLGLWQSAEIDALDSATTNARGLDGAAQTANGKAYFRAGRAAYELARYSDAEKYFRQSFAAADSEDQKTETANELKRTCQRLSEGSLGVYDLDEICQSLMVQNTVKRLQGNPRDARRALDLYSGQYTGTAPQFVDDNVTVDVFKVVKITELNGFGCPNVRSSERNEIKSDRDSASGVWLHASLANHACDGNACRAFIGDVMFVRATKNIAKDEEIFMPYCSQETTAIDLRDKTLKQWSFACSCAVCTAELDPNSAPRDRAKAFKEGLAFCAANPITMTGRPSQQKVDEAEQLYKKIETTYDKAVFKDVLPRLGLVRLDSWLVQASAIADDLSPQKIIDLGLRVLRHSGLRVALSNKRELDVDRTEFVLQEDAIDAAVHIADGCEAKASGVTDEAKEYMALAREWWVCINGEMRGFAERYED